MEDGVDIFSLFSGTGGDINRPGESWGGLQSEGGQKEGRRLKCAQSQRLRQNGRETTTTWAKKSRCDVAAAASVAAGAGRSP